MPHALLQARGITARVVCGLQSDFCVDTTTRHRNQTLANITSFGPRATPTPAAHRPAGRLVVARRRGGPMRPRARNPGARQRGKA